MKQPDVEALRKALDQNDQQQLLSVWAGRTLWALFGQDEQGVERPISVLFGEQLVMLVTLAEDTTRELIAELDSGPGVRHVVKSAPLSELARLAYSDGATLAMIGESILFQSSSLLLLGFTALLESDSGEPIYCRVTTFPLEGNVASDMAPGCVQRWSFLSGRQAKKTPRIIFDDSLDWQHNPYLMRLPSDAVPASSLSGQERAVFDKRARPTLAEVPVLPDKQGDDGTGLLASQALPASYLHGPQRIHALLEEFLFPVAKRLKLHVQPSGESSLQFDIQYLDEGYTSKGASITPISLHKEILGVQEFDNLSCPLPTAPGLHPLPAPLKGLLKRYLAWGIFSGARHVDRGFNLLGGQLRNLLAASPYNSDQRFYAEPEDQRFPYLARFRLADREIPVLVLGQQGDDYVCNPMEFAEIDGSLVPDDIPARDDLIASGTMNLWDLSGSVVLPSQYLDCPAPWYEGVRLSARWMLADVRRNLVKLSQALRDEQAA